MERTTVIFYREPDGNILAVFPYDHETNSQGFVGCYSRIGQHSHASVEYCNSLEKVRKKDLYIHLAMELEARGYNLYIL